MKAKNKETSNRTYKAVTIYTSLTVIILLNDYRLLDDICGAAEAIIAGVLPWGCPPPPQLGPSAPPPLRKGRRCNGHCIYM